jgi:hypothetical protein
MCSPYFLLDWPFNQVLSPRLKQFVLTCWQIVLFLQGNQFLHKCHLNFASPLILLRAWENPRLHVFLHALMWIPLAGKHIFHSFQMVRLTIQYSRWMFEKYDGMRGFWNPHRKLFFSRSGKIFIFPTFITSMMPDLFLDGELWYVHNLRTLVWANLKKGE